MAQAQVFSDGDGRHSEGVIGIIRGLAFPFQGTGVLKKIPLEGTACYKAHCFSEHGWTPTKGSRLRLGVIEVFFL